MMLSRRIVAAACISIGLPFIWIAVSGGTVSARAAKPAVQAPLIADTIQRAGDTGGSPRSICVGCGLTDQEIASVIDQVSCDCTVSLRITVSSEHDGQCETNPALDCVEKLPCFVHYKVEYKSTCRVDIVGSECGSPIYSNTHLSAANWTLAYQHDVNLSCGASCNIVFSITKHGEACDLYTAERDLICMTCFDF